jgi:hypothetical protein
MYNLPSRTACVPNAAELLSCIQASSDAWADVENSGEPFGTVQGATPSNHGQLIIAVSFAEVEGECWRNE